MIFLSGRWDDYGSLRWELVLCLLLAWILIALSMIKGLASYGKVAYFITLSPYFGKNNFVLFNKDKEVISMHARSKADGM